ncbi:hypothetical protein BDA96_06G209800 [Sorghum bicolor]|uniref:Uncharacterized protein n=2 Tax=Sorghum bicolor TaxID=4558 RepID=A0A921UDS6_SORBI|nr:hypothetical protein BDA96_06G209800 [Sorghum bicolor]OQU82210.1 hypothetical protein SORBI_3006G192266 [Sorghum bicolor]
MAVAPAVGGPGTAWRRQCAVGGHGCPLPPPTPARAGAGLTSRRPLIKRANGAMAVGTRQNGKRAKAADTHEDWDNGRCHRSQPIFLLGQPPIDPEQIEKRFDKCFLNLYFKANLFWLANKRTYFFDGHLYQHSIPSSSILSLPHILINYLGVINQLCRNMPRWIGGSSH